MTLRPVHLLLLLVPLSACMKPNRASIEVFAICSPPDGCSFGAKCEKYTMTNQIIDLNITGGLLLPVEIHNQMENNADGAGHLNTNDAFIQQAVVSFGAPGFAVSSATTNLVQTVPASGNTVLGLELLGAQSSTDLAAGVGAGSSIEVVADVKLKGILGDGSKFETAGFRVPFLACRGCLSGAYVCDDPTQVPSNFCPQLGQWPSSFSCGAAVATFTIGGGITSLTGAGLVVTCNGTDVPIAAGDLSWTFPAALADATAYACVINATGQPAGQNCTIANGTGTVSGANVTNLNVTCAP